MYIDDVYVIACPKSELSYDEKAEKEKEMEKKREQLVVGVREFIESRQ